MASHQGAPHYGARSSSDLPKSGTPASPSSTFSSSETANISTHTEPGVQVADLTATSMTTPPKYDHEPAILSPPGQPSASYNNPHVATNSQASQASLPPLPAPPAPSHPPSLSSMPQFSPSPSYQSSHWPPVPPWQELPFNPYTNHGPSYSHYAPPSAYDPPNASPSGHTSSPSGHGPATTNPPTTHATTGLSPFNSHGPPTLSFFSTPPSSSNGHPNTQAEPLTFFSDHPSPASNPDNPSSDPFSHYDGASLFQALTSHPISNFPLPHYQNPTLQAAGGTLSMIYRFLDHRCHTQHSLASVLRFLEGLPEVNMEELDDQHKTCGICWGIYVYNPIPLFQATMKRN